MVSHPENSGCLDLSSTESEPHSHLTDERGNVITTQVKSVLNELFAKRRNLNSQVYWTVKNWISNQLYEPDSDVDAPSICAYCVKKGEELPRCNGCRFVRYCPRKCQMADWASQLCKAFQM